MRSDDYPNRLLYEPALSGHSVKSKIPRCPYRKTTRVSYQQFYFTCIDDSSVVSKPVASRVILQMDQTAPKNQAILWHFGECRKDAGLDSSLCVCSRRNNEKAFQPPRKPLHNFTNFERVSF